MVPKILLEKINALSKMTLNCQKRPNFHKTKRVQNYSSLYSNSFQIFVISSIEVDFFTQKPKLELKSNPTNFTKNRYYMKDEWFFKISAIQSVKKMTFKALGA